MKMKRISLLLVIILVIGMLAACGGGGQTPADAGDGAPAGSAGASDTAGTEGSGETYKIGVIWQDLTNEYVLLTEAISHAYKDFKYPQHEWLYLDSQGDVPTQVSQVESLVTQGCDVIIIMNLDQDALIPSCRDAIAAGTDVIAYGANLGEDVGQFRIESNLWQSTNIGAEYVVEQLGGKGNIAILRGVLGGNAEIERTRGIMDAVEGTDIEVVFDDTGNYARDEGLTLAENWLQSGTRIDAFVCQNDEMALGAVAALKGAGLNGQVLVTGLDGITDCLDAIKAGDMSCSAYQEVRALTEGAMDMAVQICQGEEPEDKFIDYTPITKDNVDKFYEFTAWAENPVY